MNTTVFIIISIYKFIFPFQDYAGCGAVHVVGGTASLVGAILVGPRLGRFVDKGKARPIEGHTLPVGIGCSASKGVG